MEVLPLPEAGHTGYLVQEAKRALVIDPPLDVGAVTEFLPGFVTLAAVVETSVPAHRVGGGRLLAAATGVARYGPGDTGRGARDLRGGARVDGFPEAVALAAPGYGPHDMALMVGDLLFVGDLDAALPGDPGGSARVVTTRADLAGRFPDRIAHGSAGTRRVSELAELPQPPVGPPPLNAEAVLLTNRGEADLFWADPRFGADAPAVDEGYVRSRSGSPWSPTIVDLRADPEEGTLAVAPARLASEIGRLEANRQIVVRADDPATAEQAARFLRRLGMAAAWVAPRDAA